MVTISYFTQVVTVVRRFLADDATNELSILKLREAKELRLLKKGAVSRCNNRLLVSLSLSLSKRRKFTFTRYSSRFYGIRDSTRGSKWNTKQRNDAGKGKMNNLSARLTTQQNPKIQIYYIEIVIYRALKLPLKLPRSPLEDILYSHALQLIN